MGQQRKTRKKISEKVSSKKNITENRKYFLGAGLGLLVMFVFLLSPIGANIYHNLAMSMHDVDMKRDQFIDMKSSIQQDMKQQLKYRCCLEKPCTYCIEKTPGHGEGAVCDCLKDITEGVHPCGECIGEILEGHGNPFLAEYFAAAIAEKIGTQHLDTLRQIISEKYDIPIDEQL